MLKNIIVAVLFSLVLIVGSAFAATSWIELAWDANSESDLAGYRIYQTTDQGEYERIVDNPSSPYLTAELDANTTSVVLSGIEDGTYFWVATAFDTEGLESGYSNEVSQTFDTITNLAPSPPSGLHKVDSGQDPY